MLGTFSPPPWVSDPIMNHDTCVTHVPCCMPGSLNSGFCWSRHRGNVPGIPGACATRNFTYLVRGPCPPLKDTEGMIHYLKSLGCEIWMLKCSKMKFCHNEIYFQGISENHLEICWFDSKSFDSRPKLNIFPAIKCRTSIYPLKNQAITVIQRNVRVLNDFQFIVPVY